MLNKQSILITGGTGSFGKKFVQVVLEKYPKVKKIVVYSRNELKQFEMQHHTSYGNHQALQYLIGDIRDKERLKYACQDIDYIIHAAAIKHVPIAEANPFEVIKTNILGSENVIQVALEGKVKKVVALSTDKATSPINLYGASKLCADRLFIAANNLVGKQNLNFSVVRFGNLMGSSGSVIPFFLKKKEDGILPITDPKMTRFNVTSLEAVNLALEALEKAIGGELFVLKAPSYRITDLAKAIDANCQQKIIGIRPGEKLHEEIISNSNASFTIETQNYFVVIPNITQTSYSENIKKHLTHYQATKVNDDFSYSSDKNKDWLTISQIRELIKNMIQ